MFISDDEMSSFIKDGMMGGEFLRFIKKTDTPTIIANIEEQVYWNIIIDFWKINEIKVLSKMNQDDSDYLLYY